MKNSLSVKWIIGKTKGQNLKMVALILANAFFSVLSVAFALCIKGVLDGATKPNNERVMIISAILLGVVVVLQFVFRVIISSLTEILKGKAEISIKTAIFSEILKKKYSSVTKYHSGELMNRLTNDVNVITEGYVGIVPVFIGAVLRLVLAVVALVVLEPIFAGVFVVAGALVFLVMGVIRGKLKHFHKKSQESDGVTRSFMQESIENLLAVKVFSASDKVQSQSDDYQTKNYKIKMKRKNYSVWGHAFYNVIFSLSYIAALIFGAVQILNGVMNYGTLSAILQLVNNVQVPFLSISNVFPKYYAMIASAERLMEIENLEDEQVDNLLDAKALYAKMTKIKVDGVTFGYDREKVLENASLNIDKGDFVAIKGSSGIGKSTLLKLLLGVYSCEGGKITLDTTDGNIEVNSLTRKMFTYVPQGNMIFSGTLRENVTFINPDATEEQVQKALRISCVNDFLAELPKGLDTVVGEKGLGLSEGQVQRIAVARAVLSNAPVVLLDEATSALDEKTEETLLKNLKELTGITLIIVTHRNSALKICNKVVKLSKKKLVSVE